MINSSTIRPLDADAGLRLMREHFDLLRLAYRRGQHGAMPRETLVQHLELQGARGDRAEAVLESLRHHDILIANDSRTTYYLGDVAESVVSFYLGRALEASGDVLVSYMLTLEHTVNKMANVRYADGVEEHIAEARMVMNRVNSFVRANRDRALREVEDAQADRKASQYRLARLIDCLERFIAPIARIFEVSGEVNRNIELLQEVLRTVDRGTARDLDVQIRDMTRHWREDQIRCTKALREAAHGIRKVLNHRYNLILSAETKVEACDRALFMSCFDGILPLCAVENEFNLSDELITATLEVFHETKAVIDDGFEIETVAAGRQYEVQPSWADYEQELLRDGQTLDLLAWIKSRTELTGYGSINLMISAVRAMTQADTGWQVVSTDDDAVLEFSDLTVNYKKVRVSHVA